MKSFFFLILFLGSVFHNSEAADTLLIRRTIKQTLNPEGIPYNFRVVKQQFFTSDGTLFREINYNDTDGQLTSYLFVFYRNGKIFTEEFHNSADSLEYIIHHGFDKTGRPEVTTRYIPSAGKKPVIAEKQVKTYKNNVPVMIKDYRGKKIQSVTRCVYDDSSRLLNENVSWKSGEHAGTNETRQYIYGNKGGRLAEIKRSIVSKDGEKIHNSDFYTYDEPGHVTSVKTVSSSGKQVKELTYQYNKEGKVTQYEEFNSEGKRVLMLQYEYLKNIMEKGIQKSLYEDIRK